MPTRRLQMRQLREILRLKQEVGLSHRAVGEACGIASSTVSLYLERAEAAGYRWPLPAELDDATLETRLFRRPWVVDRSRPLPDFLAMHQELMRPGVTLQLLWNEYRAAHPTGYSYSQYCHGYRRWARRLKPSMRQVHRAGEKLFVDFAGQRPQYVDRETGEVVTVELFVGVLGASGLLYAEATRGQDLASWVTAHVHMLDAFQGTPAIWVPDNLRSAVVRPDRYEPQINRTYEDLAHHYGAVVIPARIRHPQDKALAEIGVLLAERWVLAALRHRTFFDLVELNDAIRDRVRAINDRPMKRLGVSRQALYERLDRPALRPLPSTRFELAEWKLCRVGPDYHVEVDHNFYSVPYTLLHEQVEVRMTARVVAEIMARRAHPEQGFRAALGLMRLGRQLGADRLEAACLRAERLGAYSFKVIENILHSGQDRVPVPEGADTTRVLPFHANVRGGAYYRRKEGAC